MTKKTDKQKITVRQNGAYRFDRYHITIESLQNTFDYFLKMNPSFKQEDLHIEIGVSHGYYDDIDVDVYIIATREETDEEVTARLEKEAEKKRKDAENARKSRAKAKAEQEIKDAQEYKRLKKKFEGVDVG